jgi:hypothetical protein
MRSEWMWEKFAWECGFDSTGSGQGPMAGCCECSEEPSGSCATELVITHCVLKILGSLDEYCFSVVLMGCEAVWTCKKIPAFRRNIVPSWHC